MKIFRRKVDNDLLWKINQARFDCSHNSTEIKKRTIKGGSVTVRAQCNTCGAPVGNALKKDSFSAAKFASMPVWNDEVPVWYSNKRSAALKALQEREEEKAKNEWWVEYEKYLKSDGWKRKRDLVIARAQKLCEGCRLAPAVDVHHMTYENAGEEFLFELVAVCRDCHKRYHKDTETSDSVESREALLHQGDVEPDCPF